MPLNDPTSRFRTLEQGDLSIHGGTLRLITVKSPALQARADVSLYLPRQVQPGDDVPVVVLLHGVYNSHWAWALSAKAHVSLQRLIEAGEIPPMILAMPSDGLWGDGSGYLDGVAGDCERWIARDVPALVKESTGGMRKAPVFLAGLSMGGYGALRIGAKHPDVFAGFSGHSAITRFEEMAQFVEEPLAAYGREVPDRDSALATMLAHQERLRPFRFDCGVDDPLIEGNRALARGLREANIPFDYEEFAGGHEWPYWEEHVVDSYRFFAGLVG